MKALLLTLSLLFGSLLSFTQVKVEPREYNVGLCAPKVFVVLHVIVEDKFLTVTDVAEGPDSAEKLDQPVSYDLKSTDEDGTRHYTRKNATFLVQIKDDKVSGVFQIDDNKEAILIGASGTEANLGSDGNGFFSACEEHRKSQNADTKTAGR